MVSAKKYNKNSRTTNKMVCRVCLQDHPLRFCKKFLKEDYEERMRLVSFYNYCAGCLSHDHTWRTCESTGKCKRCGDMHHTLLHKSERPRTSKYAKTKRLQHGPRSSKRREQDRPSSSKSSARRPSSSDGHDNKSERPSTSQALVRKITESHNTHNHRQRHNRQGKQVVKKENSLLPSYHISQSILLRATALIKLDSHGRFVQERAIINASSECSIISDGLVRRIGGRILKCGNKQKCVLRIGGNFGDSTIIEVYAEIRSNFKIVTPSQSVEDRIVDEFPGLQLADPQFNISAPTSLLLGGDIYSRIIKNGIYGGTFGKPLAQFSIFGYIISGTCTQ